MHLGDLTSITTVILQKTIRMLAHSLLSVLLLLFSSSTVWCAAICNNRCCSFVEGFPARLKMLRENYANIRDYYTANDDLDVVFLDQSIKESFKTPFACYAMDGILNLYLDVILPTALTNVTEKTKNLQPHVESIQQIFHQLKIEVTHCRHYFSCKKQFNINTLQTTYTEMDKGLYKAMGELDLLFNYIETYLASKRHKNNA